MKLFLIALTVSISVLVSAEYKQTPFDFYPMVQQGTVGKKEQNKTITNPCSILFKLSSKIQDFAHIMQLLQHYQLKSFQCKSLNFYVPEVRVKSAVKDNDYVVVINITDSQLKSVFNTSQEKYKLKITKQEAVIDASTYVGLVRAIQTFYQTIACTQNKRVDCTISHLPIQVEDYPQFSHRGLMIDTARHYLPVRIILETIDGMMYNKMNVLHWHITDDDSFPLVLESHPELAQSGAFNQQQVYTPSDIKWIVHYGLVRGVRIIPQIPTPSHSASWTKSDKFSRLFACQKTKVASGGFNILLNQTLELVKNVFAQVFQLFPDPYVHLGGEPLVAKCLTDANKNLTEQMRKLKAGQKDHQHNLAYRKQQRKILKELNSSKILVYWEKVKFDGEMDDVVHWHSQNLPNASNSKIIFSRQMTFHLQTGVGAANGSRLSQYVVWPRLYEDNLARLISQNPIKDKVIGAEVILWGQTSNEYTHHIKVWMRASTQAQRLWNSKIQKVRYSVWRRLARHARIMDQRGIPHAPITCQQCEYHPEAC